MAREAIGGEQRVVPRAESVSCDWTASSRVGARTRTRTEDFDFDFFDTGLDMRRARAGIPNASVLPLFLFLMRM